jgi:hypothetical protein
MNHQNDLPYRPHALCLSRLNYCPTGYLPPPSTGCSKPCRQPEGPGGPTGGIPSCLSAFTDAEIEFVNSHRLGRLATVGADDMPHVVPVAVFYDPDAAALVIGANAEFGEAVMTSSKKFRDAQRRPQVAVVVDDPGPRILGTRA